MFVTVTPIYILLFMAFMMAALVTMGAKVNNQNLQTQKWSSILFLYIYVWVNNKLNIVIYICKGFVVIIIIRERYVRKQYPYFRILVN